MSEEIEKLEQQKAVIQSQATFEIGRLQGRIDLLKEQEAAKPKSEEAAKES